MKLSTKGKYGLRALIDLASHRQGEPVALGQIAFRQQISENYLEQVFSMLRKAGYVKSIKGAQGGYDLAMAPERIRVGDVLRTMEGSLLIEDRDASGAPPEASSVQACLQEELWDRINEAVLQVVDSVSLSDLLVACRRRAGEDGLMFYI